MPIDLSGLGEAFARGFSDIPPIAIALGLLAGPTLAMIGYRLVGVARRLPASSAFEAAPFWVCYDCRSINELRAGRCYHCGVARDAAPEVEVILDMPMGAPARFDVPAGSPFAALGRMPDAAAPTGQRAGVPVMADPSDWSTGVPVGPGTGSHPVAVPVVAQDGEALLMAEMPVGGSSDAQLTPAEERSA